MTHRRRNTKEGGRSAPPSARARSVLYSIWAPPLLYRQQVFLFILSLNFYSLSNFFFPQNTSVTILFAVKDYEVEVLIRCQIP